MFQYLAIIWLMIRVSLVFSCILHGRLTLECIGHNTPLYFNLFEPSYLQKNWSILVVTLCPVAYSGRD